MIGNYKPMFKLLVTGNYKPQSNFSIDNNSKTKSNFLTLGNYKQISKLLVDGNHKHKPILLRMAKKNQIIETQGEYTIILNVKCLIKSNFNTSHHSHYFES